MVMTTRVSFVQDESQKSSVTAAQAPNPKPVLAVEGLKLDLLGVEELQVERPGTCD